MTSPSAKKISPIRTSRNRRVASASRERLRRLALDALEPRTLMAVLPPPIVQTRTDISGTPASNDDSPSITVDPLDPLRAVAVWTRHNDAFPLELPAQYNSLGEAAYTIDGGTTWTKFTADVTAKFTYSLPTPLADPRLGDPPLPPIVPTDQYTDTTDLTAAFDRQHNVFILESQHSIDFKSGALVLEKYDFHGASPNLTLANKIVHQWYDPNGDKGDQAHTPTLAVDTGVGNAATNMPTGAPVGIVVGPDGNTYVAVQDLNQVQQLDGGSGQFDTIFSSGKGFYRPNDITFNVADGDFYVSNRQTGQVIRLDGATGGFLGTFTQRLVTPKSPRDMVISPIDGNLYVSSKDTSSVLRYSAANGSGGSGTASTAAGVVIGIAVTSPGLGYLSAPPVYLVGGGGSGATATATIVGGKITGFVVTNGGSGYTSAPQVTIVESTGAFLGSFVAPKSGGLSQPEGLAFGQDGKLYVADAQTNQIFRYDGKTGAFIDIFVTQLRNGGLSGPRGMVFGPDRNLYVASSNTNQVLRFDRNTGLPLGVFAQPGSNPTNDLNQPTSLVFSPIDGNLLVTSFTPGNPNAVPPVPDKSEILRYNGSNGVFISSFLAPPIGGLDQPTGIAFRLNGPLGGRDEILVGSFKTDEIYRFDAHTGVFIDHFIAAGSGALHGPTGFTFASDGSFYVSSGNSNEILHYRGSDGQFLASITPEPINAPKDSLIGPDGYLYAVSRDTDSVARFDPNSGVFLGNFIASGLGGLNVPSGLVFSPDKAFLFVASSFDSRILKYDAKSGLYLGDFVTSNKVINGGLSDPEGLSFHNGNMYVTSALTEGVIEYNGVTGALIQTTLYSNFYTPEPLKGPEGTVIGPDGNLYVASKDSDEVLEYDGNTGKFLRIFVPSLPTLNGGLNQPRGLTFHNGSLFVSSYATDQVLRYNGTTGAFQGLFTPEPQKTPTAEVWNANQTLLFVASRDNGEVLEYDATGKFLGIFVTADPTLNGGLKQPNGLALDAAGKLYVSSLGTNQILRYNTDGSFDKVFVQGGVHLNGPHTLVFRGSSIYVACVNTDSVERYDATGAYQGDAVSPGLGGLNGPEGIAFDGFGDIYVAGSFTSSVLVYSPSGQFIGPFVTPALGGLGTPTGIAFKNGFLFVADASSSKVLRYDATTGAFAGQFVFHGYAGLDTPSALVFGPTDGNLYVLSQGTNQVIEYSGTNGRFIPSTISGAEFTAPTLAAPDGLSFNPADGNLYVVGHDAGRVVGPPVIPGGRIFRYDGTTGAFLGYSDPTPLRAPEEAKIGPDGNLYVASATKNQILEYNGITGNFMRVFVVQGDGGLDGPKGFAWDNKGASLYVASKNTDQILKYSGTTGAFQGVFIDVGPNSPLSPDEVIFDGSSFLISDASGNQVLRFDVLGNPQPGAGLANAVFIPSTAGLVQPSGLAIDFPNSVLYVASFLNDSIYSFNRLTGVAIATFVNNGNAKGMTQPIRIAVDAIRPLTGNPPALTPVLDVVSRNQNAVYRYSLTATGAAGTYVHTYVAPGLGGLNGAFGIALDSATNTILVASEFSDQVISYNRPVDGNGNDLPATSGVRFTPEPLRDPEDLIFSPYTGRMLVSSWGSDEIMSYTAETSTYNGVFIGPGGGLDNPQGLAFGINGDNTVYVSSEGNNSVYRYSGITGALIGQFVRPGSGGLKTPQGLTFGPKGLYVASRDTDLVLLYDTSTGAFLKEFTPEPLVRPTGLAFDPASGNLLVTSKDSDRVLLYDSSGGFLSRFTSHDPKHPQDAVIGPDGNLYVASRETNEILRYNGTDGTFKDVFIPTGLGGITKPTGLAFGKDGNLYVASSGSNEIIRFVGTTGAFINVFASGATSPLVAPQGVAVDAAGTVYVTSGSSVFKYRAGSGAFLGSFLTGAILPSQAEGIVFADTNFDGTPELYVSSFLTNQVLQYNATTGVFIKVYADTGTSASNNLNKPTNIAFDSDGTLYVSSSGNNEVIRYQAGTGSFLDVFVTTGRGGLSTPEGIAFLRTFSTITDNPLTLSATTLHVAAGTGSLFKAGDQVQIDSEFMGVTAVVGDALTVTRGANGSTVAQHVLNSTIFSVKSAKLLVASADTGQVLSYNINSGAYTGPFTPGPLIAPTRVTFGPGGVFVSSSGTDTVLQYQYGDTATHKSGDLLNDYLAAHSGDLNDPDGLVFLADGTLLVSSAGSDDILRFNPPASLTPGAPLTGLLRDSFNPARPVSPSYETFNKADGLLYVASQATNTILRYDPVSGKLLGTFIAPDSGGLLLPEGIVFGPDGNLYVASADPVLDAQGNRIPGLRGAFDKILRYDGKTGQFLDIFVAATTGLLRQAMGITFGPEGDLYVANYTNDKVLRFSGSAGAYLSDYVAGRSGGLRGPTGIVFDAQGYLYVGSTFGSLATTPVPDAPDSILRYQPLTGKFDKIFVTAGQNGLDGPTALAFDSNGDLYVTSDALLQSFITPQVSSNSSQDNRVLKFKGGTGATLGAFVARGAGELQGPSGLAFDGSGNLIVVSRDNNLLLKFDTTGTFLGRLDSTPDLYGVTFGADVNGDGIRDLYATTKDGDSVQIYDGNTGEYVRTFVVARDAGLSAPTDLIFSPDGKTLYVTSSATNQVLAYEGITGKFLRVAASGLNAPEGLALRNGSLYVANSGANNVLVFNPVTGALTQTIPAGTSGLSQPKAIAFDPVGNLLVTSFGSKNVLRFSLAGAFLGVYNHSAALGFTDPDPSKNVTQNDPFSNNVYIAWATNEFGDQHAFAAENNNAIVLTGSSDGGNSFSPPEVVNDSKFSSTTELDATPRITVSQGRPAKTLSPTDPGVPAGQVTVVWDDFGTNGFIRGAKVDISDSLNVDRLQAGSTYSTSIKYDVADTHSAIPASVNGPVTTDFTLPVNLSDPRFTTISHMDVRLSMLYPDLTLVQVDLIAPDGTRVPLIRGGPTGRGLGLQPNDPTKNSPFTIDTIFDAEAPRAISNALYAAPYVGRFRPDIPFVNIDGKSKAGPGLSALYGMDRTTANGTWTLQVTDFSGNANAKLTTQRLIDWGLDFTSNMTNGKDVVVVPADNLVARLERYKVTGIPQASPYPISNLSNPPATIPIEYTGVDGGGISAAPSLASDNTLGGFSPHQGRIYMTYVDRYIDPAQFAGDLVADNTNIYLRYSDDGGATWSLPNKVNDDNALTDGFSEAYSDPTVTFGRPKFQPAIAVDAYSGTVALSYYDARNDPQRARVATYVATSIDGGLTFAPQTFMNTPQSVTDGITGQTVILGPIPDNASKIIPGQPWLGNGSTNNLGFGQSQGLAFVNGRLYPAWSSNENAGPTGLDVLDIRVAAATVASGPRVISSTMGSVQPQTVHKVDGTPVPFNSTVASGVPGVADGTPLADGFVITFDRVVDPATLNPIIAPPQPIVQVTYRDVNTSGFAPGVSVAVNPVITPLMEGNTPQGPTKFLVRFAPRGGTGTYSYQVGPNIRDLIRSVTATGVVITGNLMDQNGDAVGGQDPRTTPFTGNAPGDVYAVPTPAPTTTTTFSGGVFAPPFDRTTQPLLIPGPHVSSTYIPNPGVVKTLDNLVTDQKVSQIAIVFDRDMDATTVLGTSVLRVVGPAGVIPGPFTVTTLASEGTHHRTFLIGFPVQQLSGTYTVTLASTVKSSIGEALDTNQNAGLDTLRGDPSGGTVVVTYKSNDSKAPIIGGPTAGRVTVSKINVPDNFVVQGLTLTINVTFPFDPELDAALIAPDGTRVQLFSGVGSTGLQADFSNTTFDDSANTPIQNGGPPFFGTFNPRFPLSVFKNHTSGGNWTLEVTDNGSGRTGTINNWTINLVRPIPATGLGDPVADQVTASFRIFTQDPTNLLASNTWTAVGPAGIGAKGPGQNAEISGRIGAIAVDPSDSSGNTVYVGAASGGIWKTTNFLTTAKTGPTYVPLTDFGPTFGLNIGGIAVFSRNNDPNQSIVFAATGDPDALGIEPNIDALGAPQSVAPSRGDSASMTSRGIGFLRSMDGGATWVLLDSTTNFDVAGNPLPVNSPLRDHIFVSTAGFKITVDPKPTPSGDVIVYAAISDVDANGLPISGAGRAGGIWRSVDSGKNWTKMKAGQATDVILDLASGTGAPDGNLQILYAAFRGDGVYRSPNRGQEFDLMAGTAGNPLIQSFDSNPTQPVPVMGATSNYYRGQATPNSSVANRAIKGRIVLARPSVTGNPLQDVLYQGWLYAAVVSADTQVTPDNQLVAGGHLEGVYLTKDFGQNWTRVKLPSNFASVPIPSNDDRLGEFSPLGESTPAGVPVPHPLDLNNFGTGNFNISLAVDPNNPNVLYLGGSSQFNAVGLMRIDTTGIADPHAFYLSNTDVEGKLPNPNNYLKNGERAVWNGWPLTPLPAEIHGPIVQSNPGGAYIPGPNAPFNPAYTPYLNLIANPRNPFLTASTIPVTNTYIFTNFGDKVKWIPFDQALKPDTFATNPSDPWATPTNGVHRIITMVDPVTHKTRLIFGDDNGIFTAIDDGTGTLIGSLGSVTSLATDKGDVSLATGSRNGNLQTTQFFYGAAEPSNLAAQVSLLKGMFYGSTDANGSPYANANVITTGQTGYGDITWARPYIERSSGAGVGVVQTNNSFPGFGSFYRYILPSDLDNTAAHTVNPPASVVTDFLQRDLTSRTFNLLQNTAGQFDPLPPSPIADVPDAQWPFNKGYNFAINPLSGEQLLISSEQGRVFSTENQGKFWNVIGNPGALDGTNAQALTYGAPDVVGPNLGNLDSFVYAGTVGGKIFVTFNGGGGNGNAWTPLSNGLDGSAIQKIVTNPTRTSHEAYAVTQKGVYHMVDSKATNPTWVNITGNLFSLTSMLFNDATQVQARLKNLTSLQADWRYIIPNDPSNPTGPSHPMLYVGGEGGVFRSIDNGAKWTFFPSADPTGVDLTPKPPGDGGGLPNAVITDLNLVLGNIDPTNGRPDISTGPNTLYATTFGRGAFTIRLAPIVFATTIGLDAKFPAPNGSDTGISPDPKNHPITNLTQPFISGLSEQSAFGSVVTISLFDLTDTSKPPVFIGSGQTDAAGRFSIQVNAGIYKANGTTDGLKTIGVQATDQSGTTGNLSNFTFTLDTTPPLMTNKPDLQAISDSGSSNTDDYTNVTNPTFDISGVETGALVLLFRDGGAKAVGTRLGNGPITDTGPLTNGNHSYVAVQEDIAGNFSVPSDTLIITVDTLVPLAPLAPDLQAVSDTGLSTSDEITKDTKPFFDVVATEATATVRLLRKLATAPASAFVIVGSRLGSGAIQDLTLPASPASDGVYAYASQQVDLAGNVGPVGAELPVTIDTSGEGPPTVPDLEAASDTGTSSTDNVTANTQPFFVVTATESPSLIQLLRKLASAPAGSYAIVSSVLASPGTTVRLQDLTLAAPSASDGVYSYAAQQMDVAGNVGARSNSLTVTIDTTGPASTVSLVLDAKSDSGPLAGPPYNGDDYTNSKAPFFDVVTSEANQKVQLFRKVKGAPDSSYVPVGTPVTIAAAGVGLLQDPIAPANGEFIYSAQQTDLSGNLGVLGAVTVDVIFDNIAPAAPVAADLQASSDTGTSSTDNITGSKTPGFDVIATESTALVQLLRKLQSDPITSYKVVGSVIGSGSVTDSQLPAPTPDGVYTYATRQVDLAGNVGAIGGTLDVTIDTTAPQTPTLSLDPRDDRGLLGDGTTSVTRPRLIGTTEANASLILFDLSNPSQPLAFGRAAADGTFSLTPGISLADGVYNLQVSATDIAANTSTSRTLVLTIDTTAPGTALAPVLDQLSDSGAFNNDSITNATSPFIDVVATESGATVQLYRKKLGDPDTSYVFIGQSNGTGKVLDPSVTVPSDVANIVYVYTTKQIDASDNAGSFGPTLPVTFDTKKPIAPPAPQLNSLSDTGIKGDGITNVKIDRIFDLFASETTATVQLFRKVFTSPDSTYTPVGTVLGSGQVIDRTSLPDGKYAYLASQTDLAGNVGLVSPPVSVVLDTQAPAFPTLNLVSADDSGIKGDFITNVKRPHFSGVTDPGSTVDLVTPSGVIASATADLSGNYTLQPSVDLLDGAYSLQARASDAAGNSSLSFTTISLVIDTIPPAVPTFSLLPADDSGLQGDGVTNVRRPKLVGATDAKTTVALLDGLGVVKASTISDASGNFVLQPPLDLADGKYTFQARATDAAGNPALSSSLPLTISTAAPSRPTIALLAADDSGVKGDSVTNLRRPRFVGKAGPNVTVNLLDVGGTLYATTTSDASGSYTALPTRDLAEGLTALAVQARDSAGNIAYSDVVGITIDTTPPPAPAVTILAADDSAIKGDFVTNVRYPRLVGKSDPNGVVALYDSSNKLLSAVLVAADGSFTLQSIYKLPLGPNVLRVTASDAAGNQGSPGAVPTLNIVATPGDYDGDGKTDNAVFDPLTSTFFIQYSAGGSTVFSFGVPNGRGLPVSGDYDGDGKTDVAVYDPTAAKFYITYSAGGSSTIQFGIVGHNNQAVPGDYDGDGRADLAVYDPVDAKFYIFYSASGILAQPGFASPNHGNVGIPGDYNGDGRADLAVFDPTTATFLIVYTDGSGSKALQFGRPGGGDLPIPADFDGDGKTDISVFDPGPAVFYELFSSGANGGSKVFQYGVPNKQGVPVYGDYDGDGKTDTTVFDPAEAKFYATYTAGGSKIFQFGRAGRKDLPIPSTVPATSAVTTASLVTDAPVDFTPVQPAIAPTAPLVRGNLGQTVLGFAFGHPDQKVNVRNPVNRVRKNVVNASRHAVKIRSAKPTAHDLALENLWENGHGG
ncbi:MAG: regulatory domain of in-like proprotein convertase [Planctomycetota bacterium]|nr:regulatory domain of in-like proprotein convertase [Planctomycetota bacterium]